MIIEYLYIYNQYHKTWIKGPFTQRQLTRYASACPYTVIKELQKQMGLDANTGELFKNSGIGIHAINVPSGMRNFKSNKVSEMDEHWFFHYWHAAGDAHRDECKPRFDYFRAICLKFSFVNKLPTYEQYSKWSDMWDDTYNGTFSKDILRYHGWGDSQRDPRFHAQFKWVGMKSNTPKKVKTYKFKKSSAISASKDKHAEYLMILPTTYESKGI